MEWISLDIRVNFHSLRVRDMLSNQVDFTSCKSEISFFKSERYVVLWSGFARAKFHSLRMKVRFTPSRVKFTLKKS